MTKNLSDTLPTYPYYTDEQIDIGIPDYVEAARSALDIAVRHDLIDSWRETTINENVAFSIKCHDLSSLLLSDMQSVVFAKGLFQGAKKRLQDERGDTPLSKRSTRQIRENRLLQPETMESLRESSATVSARIKANAAAKEFHETIKQEIGRDDSWMDELFGDDD